LSTATRWRAAHQAAAASAALGAFSVLTGEAAAWRPEPPVPGATAPSAATPPAGRKLAATRGRSGES
jgi:hypothetical protein